MLNEPRSTTAGRPATHLSRFLRDFTTLGTAFGVTTLVALTQVFIVPKLIEVYTFGVYRIFMVYAGYLGILHLGLADGALLYWAGRTLSHIVDEFRCVIRWMALSQITVLVLFLLGAWIVPGHSASVVVAALGASALAANTLTLATFAMQAAKHFRWAALGAVLPPFLFLISLPAIPGKDRSIAVVLLLYVVSQAVPAGVLLLRLRSVKRPATQAAVARASVRWRGLLRLGTPLMLANLGAGLSQSLDRVMLSWVTPPTRFALYGFATSVLFAANAAAQALGRVALPHAAQASQESRSDFFTALYDVILVGYGTSLTAYPAFEGVVRAWLPRYAAALPIVRALLVGALFWTATQVVINTTLQVSGRVGTQLQISSVAALSVGMASLAAIVERAPLWGVAAAASAGMAAGFVYGAIRLGLAAGDRAAKASIRFAATGVAQAGAMILATRVGTNVLGTTLLYVALSAAPTAWALRRVLRPQHDSSVALPRA